MRDNKQHLSPPNAIISPFLSLGVSWAADDRHVPACFMSANIKQFVPPPSSHPLFSGKFFDAVSNVSIFKVFKEMDCGTELVASPGFVPLANRGNGKCDGPTLGSNFVCFIRVRAAVF